MTPGAWDPTHPGLRPSILLSLLLVGLAGCSSTGTPTVGTNAPGRSGRIYLVRGILTPVCLGVDKLNKELQAEGLASSVHSYLQAGEIAGAIERSRREGNNEPIILIGYSTGCGTVFSIARRLERSNIPVDLLVTIEPLPASDSRVPSNVRTCLNYYQRGKTALPLLSGRPVTAENPQATSLVNVNFTDSPLRRGGINHFNMDEQPAISEVIRSHLRELCIPREGASVAREASQASTAAL